MSNVRYEDIEGYVKFFEGVVGLDVMFMYDNDNNNNPIDKVWNGLDWAIAQRNPPTRTCQVWKVVILEEWT